LSQSEPSYRYTPVNAVTAEVLAVNESLDPLLTRHKVGQGEVFLTTPSYMQSSSRDRILEIFTQLLDSLMARYSAARITGPPVEYIVNQAPVTGVLEYITDQRVEFAASPAELTIPAQVAAYGVRVFGIEYGSAALAKSPSREKPGIPLVRNQVPAGKAARSTRFH
jgi:hypothetical protein